MRTLAFICVGACALLGASALVQPASRIASARPPVCTEMSPSLVPAKTSTRRDAIRNALVLPLVAAVALPDAALAKFAPGSKEEKSYNDCLSLCAYYCMKPKGQFTKSRTDCLTECKPICKADPKSKFEG